MSNFIKEHALSTGRNSRGFFSKESDWINRDERFIKLVKNRINSKGMKLYLFGLGTFILTDKNDNYLGALEFKRVNNTINIISSDSKLEGGFYLIIFSAILTFSEIDEIISDTQISEQAFKSYLNLTKGFGFNIKVIQGDEYLDFSKENLFNKMNNKVSIKEKNSNLRESFSILEERIKDSNSWKEWFENNNVGLDQRFIYGESINKIKGYL